MLASIPRREVSTELAMRLPYADQADHARLFSECVQRLEMLVDQMTRWSDRIPVFMLNFFVPQTNYLGRLLPRYDLRNPAYFTEQLNQRLAEMIAEKNNVYLFDIDSLAASYGRQRVQDDSLWVSVHGSMLDAYDAMYDHDRLEPTLGPLDYFEISTGPFIRLCLSEAFAMYRTLKGVDTVKMACVDLDDTLWRGVMAEREFIDPGVFVSGWPLGFAEALLALKKRGIILAIISKNSEERVRGFWHDLFGEHELKLEDFAIVKINWRPKVENIQEAIAEANVLPSSVVFIDDNPVERASVKEAIPEIRVLGAPQYLWRDTLLRSSDEREVDLGAVGPDAADKGNRSLRQADRKIRVIIISKIDLTRRAAAAGRAAALAAGRRRGRHRCADHFEKARRPDHLAADARAAIDARDRRAFGRGDAIHHLEAWAHNHARAAM
jgi:HAD superfamily phosphatase (TIGR01681 family)